ncbi:hypothetical protein [Candidatus Hydrogenosomobacter endosymbioticus]|uniref:Uncharacterized protein n=1 Tax=Candidatus Hydrogenosomobacter endosymbioticus TaxID=2558174 RepID=A0ABN6L3F2_9PROT|nr:hypothetical protein [Candidatus Hydrogenosomobacter endosymbioticus]BDB96423.1 hypothetical protein HYD_5560 [Candidatus Hydrogenosomobacter endosymbioticus]
MKYSILFVIIAGIVGVDMCSFASDDNSVSQEGKPKNCSSVHEAAAHTIVDFFSNKKFRHMKYNIKKDLYEPIDINIPKKYEEKIKGMISKDGKDAALKYLLSVCNINSSVNSDVVASAHKVLFTDEKGKKCSEKEARCMVVLGVPFDGARVANSSEKKGAGLGEGKTISAGVAAVVAASHLYSKGGDKPDIKKEKPEGHKESGKRKSASVKKPILKYSFFRKKK